MKIVVDANIVIAILVPLPYSGQATHKMLEWQNADVVLAAPTLLEYELTSTLRKATVAGIITSEEAIQAIAAFADMHIEMAAPTLVLHEVALRWADRLQQSATYDAHYLALAEQLGASFWTADQRLANGAKQMGANWVYWIGEIGS